jgi:hypothetical protein
MQGVRRERMMESVVKRMAMVLTIASVIFLASGLTAQSGDMVIEEIKATYTEKEEVTVTPKIDNFIVLFDQSGSMYLTDQGKTQAKAKVAKDIMTALNERIPELGYNGSMAVFAPDRSLIGPTEFNRASFGKTIGSMPETGRIFGNRTPLGDSIMQLDGMLSKLSGKTSVLIVSDGEKNIGMDAIQAAKTLNGRYPDVCFHSVSLADSDRGRSILKEISQVNDCIYADGTKLASDPAAIDQFARDVFYTVNVREVVVEKVVEEVVAVEATAVVPEVTGGLDVYLIAVDDHGYRDVDVVNVRVRAAVRDVGVTGIDLPEPAIAGEDIDVSVGVINTGNTPETFEVGLADAEAGTVSPASREITLESEEAADVPFVWTPSDVGRHRLTATVAPLPDEASGEDNTLVREVDVTYDPDAGIHVADLDGAADPILFLLWRAGATASIEDATGTPVQGADVRMRWSTGLRRVEDACVTDAQGRCRVDTGIVLMGAVSFEVIGVSAPGMFYAALENEDPDGDSDGTLLNVDRPPLPWARF